MLRTLCHKKKLYWKFIFLSLTIHFCIFSYHSLFLEQNCFPTVYKNIKKHVSFFLFPYQIKYLFFICTVRRVALQKVYGREFSGAVFTVNILQNPVAFRDLLKNSGKTENIKKQHPEFELGPPSWQTDALTNRPYNNINNWLKHALNKILPLYTLSTSEFRQICCNILATGIHG